MDAWDLASFTAITIITPNIVSTPPTPIVMYITEVLKDKTHQTVDTGDKTRFLANENLRKILKVSHFFLLFSQDENINESKHFHRDVFGFLLSKNPASANGCMHCFPEVQRGGYKVMKGVANYGIFSKGSESETQCIGYHPT